jgi:hypothetical protein
MSERMVKWMKLSQNSLTDSYKFSEITVKKKERQEGRKEGRKKELKRERNRTSCEKS